MKSLNCMNKFLTMFIFSTFFLNVGETHATQNLIVNGSFEFPQLVPGSDALSVPVNNSTLIPGWRVVGPRGLDVAVVENNYDAPDGYGNVFNASDGVQFLDLTGFESNRDEGVQQSVFLGRGFYDLAFDVGNIISPGTPLGIQSTVALYINGVLINSFLNNEGIDGRVKWKTFHHTFLGDGVTVISFINADPLGDNLNVLDVVTLTSSTSTNPTPTIPEPTGPALMSIGLIGWLLSRKFLPLFRTQSTTQQGQFTG